MDVITYQYPDISQFILVKQTSKISEQRGYAVIFLKHRLRNENNTIKNSSIITRIRNFKATSQVPDKPGLGLGSMFQYSAQI